LAAAVSLIRKIRRRIDRRFRKHFRWLPGIASLPSLATGLPSFNLPEYLTGSVVFMMAAVPCGFHL
jgi:hypothetical protein